MDSSIVKNRNILLIKGLFVLFFALMLENKYSFWEENFTWLLIISEFGFFLSFLFVNLNYKKAPNILLSAFTPLTFIAYLFFLFLFADYRGYFQDFYLIKIWAINQTVILFLCLLLTIKTRNFNWLFSLVIIACAILISVRTVQESSCEKYIQPLSYFGCFYLVAWLVLSLKSKQINNINSSTLQ